MTKIIFANRFIQFLVVFFLIISNGYTQQVASDNQLEYTKAAERIKSKYEKHAYKFKPGKAGHMGLRLWRNYEDDQYKYLLVQGVNHAAHALDKLVKNGLDEESLNLYVSEKNVKYKAKTEKKRLRKETFKRFPRYRLMGTKILRHVARLDELGLKHEKHEAFMALIRGYDYESAFTDPEMIRAWGAQLANQVYWLHNIGVADHRAAFMRAVEDVYPEHLDNALSDQQYENKIYTLTHIIIAASEYYRYNVTYSEYSEIIDYMRKNHLAIIDRVKEDVIIEVGLSLLLVNENFEEITTIRDHILSKVDPKQKMILSKGGNAKVAQGEHRNIIAVLLLDWGGCSLIPSSNEIKKLSGNLAGSLQMKNSEVY